MKPVAYIVGHGPVAVRAKQFYRRWYRILDELDPDGEVPVAPLDRVIIVGEDFREVAQRLMAAGVPPEKLLVADPEVRAGLYAVTPGLAAVGMAAVLVFALAVYGAYKLIVS